MIERIGPKPAARLISLADTWEMVQRAYLYRACFVCDRTGFCAHREPEVEIAHLEGWAQTAERIRRAS